MYTELIIGDKSYKLRLTTKNSVQLERTLGYNPITLFMDMEKGKMPKLNDILIILQAMLQTFHHGMTLDKVYDLYDDYVAEGNSWMTLIPELIKVFQDAGYLPKDNSIEAEDFEEVGKN